MAPVDGRTRVFISWVCLRGLEKIRNNPRKALDTKTKDIRKAKPGFHLQNQVLWVAQSRFGMVEASLRSFFNHKGSS